MEPTQDTDELLRMIGREIQAVRAATERTASSTGIIALVVVLNLIVLGLWVFGVIEVTFDTGL